jgi:hypothetical protein
MRGFCDAVISGINCRTTIEQSACESRAAVVLQRAEQRVAARDVVA